MRRRLAVLGIVGWSALALCVSCRWFGTDASIRDAELITVTDTSFAVSWVTESPLPGRVAYGTARNALDREVVEPGNPTRFHYVDVTGLTPGTRYWYRIGSGAFEAPDTRYSPGHATTLTPPGGPESFTFALLADLHVGEGVAGLIILPIGGLPPLTPGFSWPDPDRPYWRFMLEAAVDGVNETNAAFTVVLGDLTSGFTEEEFRAAKEGLDRLEAPYYVLRGNHDRTGGGHDWLLDVFGLERAHYSFDHGGVHFVCLDTNRLSDGWMEIGDEQLDWLKSDLAANADAPTFLFAHWPIARPAAGGDSRGRRAVLEILRNNPRVVGCFTAHSHRARVTVAPLRAGDFPYVSVPPVKEYPGGFATVRISARGYLYNFWRTHTQECLEWEDITRGEYFGWAPRIQFGDEEDRNFVWEAALPTADD